MGEPVVIGPLLTAFGFRSWYWACRPTMLVAVPAGFWVAIRATLTTGGRGGVVGGPGHPAELAKDGQWVEHLLSASDEELARIPGAIVYRTWELQSITCKRMVLGASQHLVVTTTNGRRKKYALGNTLASDEAVESLVETVEALRSCYGAVVQIP